MKPDPVFRVDWHAFDCACPLCRPRMPGERSLHPIDRAVLLLMAGMATGAVIVAGMGNLGAALRALFWS